MQMDLYCAIGTWGSASVKKTWTRKIVASVFILLLTIFSTPFARAGTYYINRWNVGSTVGYGHWNSYQAAGQAGIEIENRLFSSGYTIDNCTMGPPTAPGNGGFCYVYSGGMLAAQIMFSAVLSPNSTKDVGSCCREAAAGDPIATPIGNKTIQEQDFIAGRESPMRFTRFYNSSPASSSSQFFQAWAHNYAMSVNFVSATSVFVTRPDGKAYTFTGAGASWSSDVDVSDTLVQLTSGGVTTGWQYTNAADDSLEIYDVYGNLSSITYRDGKSVTLAYVSGGSAPLFPALLLSVTDSFGNKLSFNSTSSPRTMTDPKGEVYSYALGPNDELTSATYPDGKVKTYLYNKTDCSDGTGCTNGTNLPYVVTGVQDGVSSRNGPLRTLSRRDR